MVQDVWYLREKAGIAELFGAEANTAQTTSKSAPAERKRPKSSLRLFITITAPYQTRMAQHLPFHTESTSFVSHKTGHIAQLVQCHRSLSNVMNITKLAGVY